MIAVGINEPAGQSLVDINALTAHLTYHEKVRLAFDMLVPLRPYSRADRRGAAHSVLEKRARITRRLITEECGHGLARHRRRN